VENVPAKGKRGRTGAIVCGLKLQTREEEERKGEPTFIHIHSPDARERKPNRRERASLTRLLSHKREGGKRVENDGFPPFFAAEGVKTREKGRGVRQFLTFHIGKRKKGGATVVCWNRGGEPILEGGEKGSGPSLQGRKKATRQRLQLLHE